MPHFEKRHGAGPEISGLGNLVDVLNVVKSPHQKVLQDLREAKRHFAGLLERRVQTDPGSDGEVTQNVITPILRSENARTPGLHAIGCSGEERMTSILNTISRSRPGQEGHVRFHLGVIDDSHRIPVDAFQHKEGGFTLICVDSNNNYDRPDDLGWMKTRHPNLIKGVMDLPTFNQVHEEGCRIFAVHALNAMHDYQPYFEKLHREIYAGAQGKPTPELNRPHWDDMDGVHIPDEEQDVFGLLPGKFFKHMQVKKPKEGETRTSLDEAEEKNPALKDQPVNKKGQTLRERIASQNPDKPIDQFSRADRTASLDRKRLVLIDRAIAHYEGLARTEGPDSNWKTSVLGKRPRE